MTERLYYDHANLVSFEARVAQCVPEAGAFRVRLDATAFYPTSGGQPCDHGVLGGARVTDVVADGAGEVWHVCDAPLAVGEAVRGEIDWARRFDHMQQHAADHVIAGYVHRLWGGYTVGLHLGAEFSTIDIMLPGGETRFSLGQIQQLEDLANADVQRDLPIRCFFPSPEQMDALPLRKDPSVSEHIRVVLIGDEECCACGGTHPEATGQIGPVKILWTAPSRGKLRLAFVAGMRALRDYQARFDQAERAAALLSAKPDGFADALEALLERNRQLEAELSQLKKQAALGMADGLSGSAKPIGGGWRLIAREDPQMDVEAMRQLAKKLTCGERVVVLLGNGNQLLFARSESDDAAAPNMGALLSETARALGGKGGGRPDFAQGAAGAGAIHFAEEKLQ